MATLGNDNFTHWTSSFVGRSAAELVDLYKRLMDRLSTAEASVAHSTREVRSMSHQLSEVAMVL